MRIYRDCLVKGYDISCLIDTHASESMGRVYFEGANLGFDLSGYIRDGFNMSQVRVILRGLKEGLDVSKYADIRLDSAQMGYIRKALSIGTDAWKYVDVGMTSHKMGVILDGVAVGVDLRDYGVDMGRSSWELLVLIDAIKNGLDIDLLLSEDYDEHQLIVLRDGISCGLDVSKYADVRLDSEKMDFIYRVLLEESRGRVPVVDTKKYIRPEYPLETMELIVLLERVGEDSSTYDIQNMSYVKKIFLQKAILCGLDYKFIAGLSSDDEVMSEANERKRCKDSMSALKSMTDYLSEYVAKLEDKDKQ